MIQKDTTAILLNWRRFGNIQPIIDQLNATGVVDEIIIWNNNPDLQLKSKNCTVINSSHNYKAFARYSAAMLAKGKNIIFQDDDLLFSPDDIIMLHRELLENPHRIYGFAGRNLDHGVYTKANAFGEVDIVLGQFMLFSRDLLGSVYGDFLKLAPFERGDDIAFSLLTNVKHICRNVQRKHFGDDNHALWREPGHFEMRQEMVDRILVGSRQVEVQSG